MLSPVNTPSGERRGPRERPKSSSELDLFDAARVREAVCDMHAVLQLATHIAPPDRRKLPGAWDATGRAPTRPGFWLTARCPAMRRSSWCPRSRLFTRPAGQ
jgi:hypothetical protein